MKLFKKSANTQKTEQGGGANSPSRTSKEEERQILSAIALALHMHVRETREFENTFVTIQKAIKPYSPWSSKIYGLRQRPVCQRPYPARLK